MPKQYMLIIAEVKNFFVRECPDQQSGVEFYVREYINITINNSHLGIVGLNLKLISHPFYGTDTIQVEFLADFTDMYINGAVAYNYFGAPDSV